MTKDGGKKNDFLIPYRLHRQVVGNAFQLPVLKNCVEVFFDLTTVLYNQIDSQEIVEIAPLLRAFALDSVGIYSIRFIFIISSQGIIQLGLWSNKQEGL